MVSRRRVRSGGSAAPDAGAARGAAIRSLARTVAPLLLLSFGLGPISETPAAGRQRPEHRRVSDRYDRIVLPSSVAIEPVRSTELFAVGGSHAVRLNGPIEEAVALTNQVSRSLPDLWRIDFDAASAGTAVFAQYQLLGADGAPGHLTLAGGDASIPVFLEPLDPLLGRAFDGAVKAEGGVTLHLDLSNVTHAGAYTGTLVVTINRF